MKVRKSVLVICLALATVLALAGCGGSKTTETTAKTEETTETTTTTLKQEETTTAVQQDSGNSGEYTVEQLVDKTKTFLGFLNQMEQLASASVDRDTANTFTKGNKTYDRFVTNSFNTVADITSYPGVYLTDNAINEQYSALASNEGEMYLDIADGNEYGVQAGLYVLQGGRGSYDFTTDDITIQDGWSDQAFTAVCKFTSANGDTTLTLKFVYSDDGWKIDDISIVY